MLKILVLLVTQIWSIAFANIEVIQQFDQQQYSPAKYGLKDLTFEIRVENLEQDIKKRFSIDQIKDLHFKVYWLTPGRTAIEVHGLPTGFEALRNELKKIVVERIEYVVPQDMATRLRSYDFKLEKNSNGQTVLNGTDKTSHNVINQIQLVFDRENQLRSMKTTSPSGSNTATFQASEMPWSHSKKVVREVALSGVMGLQKTNVVTKLDYVAIDGFGFPAGIESITKVTAMTNQDEKSTNEMSSKMTFSSYKINDGSARKYFMELDAQ